MVPLPTAMELGDMEDPTIAQEEMETAVHLGIQEATGVILNLGTFLLGELDSLPVMEGTLLMVQEAHLVHLVHQGVMEHSLHTLLLAISIASPL